MIEGTADLVSGNRAYDATHGIHINPGSHHNVFGNTAFFTSQGDLADDNPACGTDAWWNNVFGTANQTCIQ